MAGTTAAQFVTPGYLATVTSWPVTSVEILFVVAGVICVAAVWWARERRMASQRRGMIELNLLGEEIIAASSPLEMVRKVDAVLPRLWGLTDASLYLHDSASGGFRRIAASGESGPLSQSAGPVLEGIGLCYQNRTLLAISDTRRSAFFRDASTTEIPRSILFVPAFARNEVSGVLVMQSATDLHVFSDQEQAAAQHLANQIGTAMRLQDQQAVREQLFRSEKLAASGELMSVVADELRSPLEAIEKAATALRNDAQGDRRAGLDALMGEARRALEIVGRLISFSRERAEIQQFDVNDLLASALKFQTPDLTARHIDLHSRFSAQPLAITGSRSQLEQALFMFLQHAERSAAQARQKRLSVSTTREGSRAVLEIAWSCLPELLEPDVFEHQPQSGAPSLAVCRNVIRNHGGDVRMTRILSTQSRFEIELPCGAMEAPTLRPLADVTQESTRKLTALVVDPDAKEQAELVRLLTDHGHRAVPVGSAEQAEDLAERMRFDLILCGTHLPNLTWMELFESVQQRTAAFVLIAEPMSPELARVARGSSTFTLSRPVQAREMARMLQAISARIEASEAAARQAQS
ncbi:MAG TPA: GAF domain-containing protein [Bryobacteraceae bacterium]|nr:GAF domain-containing protein [Bryobacteraceae bacterium]